MRHEPVRYLGLDYEPGSWRQEEPFLSHDERVFAYVHRARSKPDVWDQSRLLELLGLINYRVLTGNKVYIQVGGSVFRTLYAGYWRSVFTGTEHYLLRARRSRARSGAKNPVVQQSICRLSTRTTAGPWEVIQYRSCCPSITRPTAN